ncbi:Retrovirus-related Pol polyprotein from transposon 17.6 [Araneus ventricosus]|uniref:RNA-directed DNA polymerase n=1 Tax=Araneus ventricosus TaxID=182803 RepID=A0A4Y2JMM3_ARAVE|nr:Retrovirus-related Pol polyprotein from transposon 17.6 [Araneus ventricosus]
MLCQDMCKNKLVVIIPSIDELDGIKRLSRVLQTTSEYGLEPNLKKCNFLKSKIKLLGYIIENGKISHSLDKTAAVKNFPEPKSLKQVQSFLGLTGYFRKFIQNYPLIANPLSDLLRDNTVFYFGPEQQSEFQTLKQELSENPVLHRIFKQSAKLELHTDASKFGYSAILFQQSDDNKFHLIHYMSKKNSPHEEKYLSYELEVLAIIEALKKFRNYLVAKLSLYDPTKWYKFVPAVQRTLNSTVSRRTQWTPFELLTGVKMKAKEDLQILELLKKESVESFIEDRENIRKEAKKNNLKVQEENRRNYNKKREKKHQYKVGELRCNSADTVWDCPQAATKILRPLRSGERQVEEPL